jgi:hypothetical protein
MSEFETFEAELAGLEPRQPSAELKSRIANRLESTIPSSVKSTSRRVEMRVAIFGGFIAAGLAAIIFWWGSAPHAGSDPRTMQDESLLAQPFNSDAPSVWSFRSALVRSPMSIESLLDQHSADGVVAKSGNLNIHAFARLDSNTNDLFGEL